MRFEFKAFGENGEIISSSIDAISKNDAVSILKGRKLRLISVNAAERNKLSNSPVNFLKNLWKFLNKKPEKLTSATICIFFEKVYRMLSANLTLADAIASIHKSTSDGAERAFAAKLTSDLSSGKSFYESITSFGLQIDSSVLSIISVGEATGKLADALMDALEYMHSQTDLKKKMVSSLIYPSFMITFAIVIMLGFGFLIIPAIENFVTELGGTLPPIAVWMRSFIENSIKAALCAVILFVIIIIYARISRKSKAGKRRIDGIILRLPVVSGAVRLFFMVSVSNMMRMLLGNGVDIVEALRLVKSTITNSVLSSNFAAAEHDILEGKGVSTSFEKYGIFSAELCDILAVGEKIGNIALSFKDVYKIYSENLKIFMKKLPSRITAAVLTFAFSLIGLLVLTIIQTLMGMTSSLSIM
jgi:type IV pilus assembly protein PilC